MKDIKALLDKVAWTDDELVEVLKFWHNCVVIGEVLEDKSLHLRASYELNTYQNYYRVRHGRKWEP